VEQQSSFLFNGRIALKHDGERSSASIRWLHRNGDDDILVMAPFGQTLAHLYGQGATVILDTADQHYIANNIDELTQQALGWHLPLAGLRYWVLAQPAPGSEFSMKHEANGQVSSMRQQGWEISYTRYASPAADSLPLRLSLQRGGMECQLLIDEWEIQKLP
jgi:outer membrane lipoprotein LolB